MNRLWSVAVVLALAIVAPVVVSTAMEQTTPAATSTETSTANCRNSRESEVCEMLLHGGKIKEPQQK